MLVFALLLAVAVAQTPTNPTCCSHSYWTGRCTGCPGYWYQTCDSGYRDSDQKGCGFLGCETKCYNSCRYKNYGCGCNNSTSCHKKDCVLSGWSNWSGCSKACGTGTQTRTRSVMKNAAYGGKACPSPLKETRNCNTQCCAVNCAVSGFGGWGDCSKTCGGGTQRRTQTITTTARCGGTACPALFQDQACNTADCPVDCVVDSFGEWSTCEGASNCGTGKQTRTRSVTTAAANGGVACPDLSEEQACDMAACPTPAPSESPTLSPTQSPTSSCKTHWETAVAAAKDKKKCKAINGKLKKKTCKHKSKLKCNKIKAKTADGDLLCLCIPGCAPDNKKKNKGKKCKGTGSPL